jgi:predicted metalloprotease with PDZ domain
VQINGERAGRDFERNIANLGPGSRIKLVVSRAGIQHEMQWNLGATKQKVFRLEDVRDITADQKSRRAAWLFGTSAAKPALAQ